MTKTYEGFIVDVRNEEDEPILNIQNSLGHITPIAEVIEEHIVKYGKYLSVSYYTSNCELTEDKLRKEFLKHLFGVGSAKYYVQYSEMTGYLWTDEYFKIGGHNLLEELRCHIGSYVSMKIKYSRKETTIDR